MKDLYVILNMNHGYCDHVIKLVDMFRTKSIWCNLTFHILLFQNDINQMTLTWGVEISKVQMSVSFFLTSDYWIHSRNTGPFLSIHIMWSRSEIKVIQEANQAMSGASGAFNALKQVLFPPGSSTPSTLPGFPPSIPLPQSQTPAILPMNTTNQATVINMSGSNG